VPKEGLEPSQKHAKTAQKKPISSHSGPSECFAATSGDHGTHDGTGLGPGEVQALRLAIDAALKVGRYDIVRQLAGELEQRTRPASVTTLAARKGA